MPSYCEVSRLLDVLRCSSQVTFFLSGTDTVWIQVQGLLSEAEKSKRASQTQRLYPGTIKGSADEYNWARRNAMFKRDRVNTGKRRVHEQKAYCRTLTGEMLVAKSHKV